ncbi:MAG: hypothetical protein JO235_27830 [Chroococcidiopsidaceae cyanobacterium CP_BM_RX_35]|nr:hypothetical protein [Chroococcidiopsidaceae cyanobacterium CP_BM_RX_35]
MRGKVKVWGTPTTCTIVYRHGKWYASITINVEPVSRELGTGTVSLLNGGNLRTQLTSSIGIDFGTNTAAAVSISNLSQMLKSLLKRTQRRVHSC